MVRKVREPGDQRVADYRQKDILSLRHDGAADAEKDKADRDDQVRVALERRESFDQPAGGRAVDLDAAAPLVERSYHDRDRGDQPAGDWRDPAVLQLPPRLPGGLDQNAPLTAFDRGVIPLPGAHVAPDRRVVVGLR